MLMSSPKNGDVGSGTLRVKAIPGIKQKLFSFTQAMLGGWFMQGDQAKQGELTHADHKPIIFDKVLKAGNSVLLAAKMVVSQESRRGQWSDGKWKTIKRILPQSDRTCWTSFDGCHSKVLQGKLDRQG